ncbi:unnamed protein product, partial [Ceratitis capitata]
YLLHWVAFHEYLPLLTSAVGREVPVETSDGFLFLQVHRLYQILQRKRNQYSSLPRLQGLQSTPRTKDARQKGEETAIWEPDNQEELEISEETR